MTLIGEIERSQPALNAVPEAPGLLRFITAGSVDDGKSTLIGRLLFDSKSLFDDQMESLRLSSLKKGLNFVDLSLATYGLRAEREQGITIDVAYRSMSLLDGRRLIISDAPGHEQYTRNMAVAASRAQISIVLVDATKGVRTQTLRHLTICSLMGVERVLVAVNKLDAVGFQESVYTEIKSEIEKTLARLDLPDVHFRVACSKGTYIRSLAHDFGKALNNGGHLSALRRTKIGEFDVKNAHTIEAVIAHFDGSVES